MQFSLAYMILCICSIYFAVEKDKETKRRCEQSLDAEYTSSKIAHK